MGSKPLCSHTLTVLVSLSESLQLATSHGQRQGPAVSEVATVLTVPRPPATGDQDQVHNVCKETNRMRNLFCGNIWKIKCSQGGAYTGLNAYISQWE